MEPDLLSRTQKLLQAPLRWDAILPVAWRHGVTSLLYKNLKRADQGGAIPRDVSRTLLKLYHRTGYRNLQLFQSLGDLLGCFATAGVRVIVLKGPYLAQLLYTDFASRPFRDIDLLVQKEDLEQARTVLHEAGYALLPELLDVGLSLKHHFSLPFINEDNERKTYIELHWNLTDRFMGYRLDMDDVWARARPAILSSHQVYSFSLEDLIIYLSLHLDMHGYLNRAIIDRGDELRFVFHSFSENRLIWFTDLYEVIVDDQCKIDWDTIVQHSRRAGTEGSLATSLTLLNLLFGPVVDTDVLKELELPRTTWMKRSLLRWMLTGSTETSEGEAPSRKFFRSTLLATRQGVQFRWIRLVGLWEYIFPSHKLVKRRYNVSGRGSVALYYVIHVLASLAQCVRFSLNVVFFFLKRKLVRAFPRMS